MIGFLDLADAGADAYLLKDLTAKEQSVLRYASRMPGDMIGGGLIGVLNASVFKSSPAGNLVSTALCSAASCAFDMMRGQKLGAGHFAGSMLTSMATGAFAYYATHGLMHHEEKKKDKSWAEKVHCEPCVTSRSAMR
jgi:hypothetical protein